jgi:hypothetical protein
MATPHDVDKSDLSPKEPYSFSSQLTPNQPNTVLRRHRRQYQALYSLLYDIVHPHFLHLGKSLMKSPSQTKINIIL